MTPIDDRVLRSVLDRSSDLITLADARSEPFYVSPSSLAILGRTPEEILASGLRTHLDPDEGERLRELYRQLLEAPDSVVAFRYRLRHRDGSWRTLDAVAQNFLASPEIGAIVVQARDITTVVAREAEVRGSERRCRALTEFGGDGISILDRDGTLLYRNTGATRIVGYGADETSGRLSFDRVHPDDV